ncbi:DUF3294 domain-containing protein [Mitsuaria sp. CC2]|uniref:hypothetical protein n=1 Tax=Mitsuaria sp. CC2 TaxID=3029186 RepID=UPI003B8CDE50
MEIDVFLALTSAGVSEAKARSAAESIRREADQIRDAQQEMATKSDLKEMASKSDLKDMATKNDLAQLKSELQVDMANLKSDLSQRLVEMQRSSMAMMFGGFGMMAATMALLNYLR